MSRLIYAEDVKALINGLDSLPFEEEVDDLVDRIPTAYDVDKVVEQLDDEAELSYADFERYAEEHYMNIEDDDFRFGLRRAIDIVKAGGIDE